MVRLDQGADVPVYQQIADDVRMQVAAGRLRPGDRLEPVRDLARRLDVNASTVARAYQLLEHDGVIHTNRRGGSMIAGHQDDDALQALRQARLRSIVERGIVEALAHGYHPEEVQAAFNLQLAVWRERRGRPGQQPPPGTDDDRLLHFAGSHDLAMEALWAQARAVDPSLAFSASYVGSLDGLLALLHGDAALAGTHILDEETGEYNVPILRRLFAGRALTIVTLADREQGLILARGNPHAIRDLGGLAQPGVRLINRQPGSGTRTLLDYHLRRLGISTQQIAGYNTAAATHIGVAAAVAEGRADAGLGLVAAARAYDLDFVPLARERYDLVMMTEDRERGPIPALLQIIASSDFRSVVAALGGYDTTHTGEERSLS